MQLKSALERVELGNGVVVCIFANKDYGQLLVHWLRKTNRVTSASPVVFCLDEDTANLCERLEATFLLTPFSGDWLGFMRHQMRLTIDILELGYSPLISDIDAIWVRDPIPYTVSLPHDAVFSPGTIQPLGAHRAWGNVLCTGYFLLRPVSPILALLKKTLPLMEKEGDQPALNRILAERGFQFDRDDLYAMKFRGHDVLQSAEARTGVQDGLSIALLPNRLFQRLAEPDEPEPFIIHPVAPKIEADKISVFREMGIWDEELVD